MSTKMDILVKLSCHSKLSLQVIDDWITQSFSSTLPENPVYGLFLQKVLCSHNMASLEQAGKCHHHGAYDSLLSTFDENCSKNYLSYA